jgi:hypothetical protein
MELASAQARQTGEERSAVIRHLYQKISVLLARGNAALLLIRFPTFHSKPTIGPEFRPNFKLLIHLSLKYEVIFLTE